MVSKRNFRSAFAILNAAYANETPELAAQSALQQIEEQNYAAEFFARGRKSGKCLALVFEGKKVWVKEA